MHFSTTISSLFVLLSVATAAPTEEKRQGKSDQKLNQILSYHPNTLILRRFHLRNPDLL